MKTFRFARKLSLLFAIGVLAIGVAACGGTPTPTPVPPSPTPVPSTATAVPPTATPAPPTATAVPPTATRPAATATVAAAPAATATTAPSGGGASADKDALLASFTAMSKANSYALKVTMEGNTGVPGMTGGEIQVETVQAPVKAMHMKMGDSLEIITIGSDTYMKMGAAWQKLATTGASPIDSVWANLSDYTSPTDVARSLQTATVTRLPGEKIDGVDTDVYRVVSTANNKVTTTTSWIGKADKLPVKEIIETADPVGKITVVFSNWNKVTITAPM